MWLLAVVAPQLDGTRAELLDVCSMRHLCHVVLFHGGHTGRVIGCTLHEGGVPRTLRLHTTSCSTALFVMTRGMYEWSATVALPRLLHSASVLMRRPCASHLASPLNPMCLGLRFAGEEPDGSVPSRTYEGALPLPRCLFSSEAG